jgi:hypothetical protein
MGLVEKRSISATIKLSAADWELLQKAADHVWPKALLTRSSIILGMAKIGAESVLPASPKPPRRSEKR